MLDLMRSASLNSSLQPQPYNLHSIPCILYALTCSNSQHESKSIMKAPRDGSGGEHEVVLSFEKALVYCWRACIYFMPPQIVGKGRAGSVGVIREVEGRERQRQRGRGRGRSATESCFAQILLAL